MRIHPRALLVAAAFWGTLLFVTRDVRWGLLLGLAAGLIDWATLALPFVRFSTSNRSRS